MVEQGLAKGPWSFTDHGKKAEERIKANPHDVESWNVLVREAQVSGNELRNEVELLEVENLGPASSPHHCPPLPFSPLSSLLLLLSPPWSFPSRLQ